mgnify:CR=1 FL=1
MDGGVNDTEKLWSQVNDIEEANTFLRAEVVRLRDEMKANQT